MTEAVLGGLAIGALYVLMSIGFALNLEIADIVNAAHGAFVVGAMYTTLRLVSHGVPVYPAILLSGVIVGFFSWIFYLAFMRSARAQTGHRIQLVYSLLFFSALTALYQLFFGANIQTLSTTFGSVKMFGGYLTTAQIASIALALVIPGVLYGLARFSMLGKVAYTASRYPLGARSIGVPVDRVYMIVFVLAGVLAGIAGGALVTFLPVQPGLGLQYTVVVFLVALVARTNLLGCVIVGFLYGVVESVLAYHISASTATTVTIAIFFVALMAQRFLPYGRRLLARSARKPVGASLAK